MQRDPVMQQDAQTLARQMSLIWMGLLAGVAGVAGVMYWLPVEVVTAFPGGQLWWLAILLPVAPALILRQRMRAKEREGQGSNNKEQELRTAYLLCWSVADMAVMLGAPIGMISGQKEMIIGGLLVSGGLLLLCRPDTGRHI